MDAIVVVRGRAGERSIPFADFHRLPGDTPERDNALDRGDLIVSIEVPACAEGHASHYLKVRDRESYEFALVSAAAAVACTRAGTIGAYGVFAISPVATRTSTWRSRSVACRAGVAGT